MNERGINSFEEFLLVYLVAGFLIGGLWVVLEADIVLSSASGTAERRARRRRICRLLAPLGVVHVGFALLAADAARRDADDIADASTDGRRRRAAAEAATFLFAGMVVLLAASSPHLPMLHDAPGASTLAELIPWG
jgi:hypothetical protein